MSKPIQDRVSDWTLAIWAIVVIAAVVVNHLPLKQLHQHDEHSIKLRPFMA